MAELTDNDIMMIRTTSATVQEIRSQLNDVRTFVQDVRSNVASLRAGVSLDTILSAVRGVHDAAETARTHASHNPEILRTVNALTGSLGVLQQNMSHIEENTKGASQAAIHAERTSRAVNSVQTLLQEIYGFLNGLQASLQGMQNAIADLNTTQQQIVPPSAPLL